jgi:hypothetical protein
MTQRDFEARIKEYKSEIKETRIMRPLSDDEMKWVDKNIDYIPDDYKSSFILALGGDFSEFEKLPHLLRNYLGALELKKFREKFDDAPSLDSEDVREYLEKNAMNAALRAGISAEKNAESTRESALALDSYMNRILMKRTMQPTTPSGKERLVAALDSGERAEAAIGKNAAKQLVMAKMMLLAQLGKYEVIDKNGLSKELDVPVYETLVHGNRTNFVLPAGDDSAKVIDAFMGQNGGADAGIEKRTAATHSVKRRKLGKSGELKSDSKEQRTYSPFKVFGNQYGMDIAVGGLGESGPGGEDDSILGEGKSGHLYMRAEAGDSKHCGSLLIGIEGSAPGKDSYLGNSHSILGKSAKQSAFLADKSIVGKKVGGRQVDLSGISASDLSSLLNTFSEKYTALQRGANTPDGLENLTRVNDMLMGEHMDIDKMMEMFAALDMNDKGLNDIVSQARNGYLSGIDPTGITDEEFKQSVRAKFSQEQACNIAEARFEYAGDDFSLAVGAVKELIFTHETRSLGWKLLHPIKNYRENATISSLIKRLETEKGFDIVDIAGAMGYYDNTFALDWGNDLSNDRAVIRFAKYTEGGKLFKPTEQKLLDVLKQTQRNIRKKLGDAMLTEEIIASEEVSEMQEDLQRALNGEDISRESIIVEEEDDAKKNMDEMSEVIIPQQSIKKTQKEI